MLGIGPLRTRVVMDRSDVAVLSDGKWLSPHPVGNRVHMQIGARRNSIDYKPQIESNALRVVVPSVVRRCERIEIDVRSHAVAQTEVHIVVRCGTGIRCIEAWSK